MTTERCTTCHQIRDDTRCWRCQRNCRRKRRFASYEQAREVRDLMRDRDDDWTLDVYACDVYGGEHWHIGHAGGQRARNLLRRREKLRRKALIASLASCDKDGSDE